MSASSNLRRRLAELVASDTQNPTGNTRPLADALARELRALGARTVEVFEADGHHATYARFGPDTPTLLVNAHIDTVPANAGYSAPPLSLVEREGRLYGLGSADTKGAIAAILEALAIRATQDGSGSGSGPERSFALLFSGDEEKGNACISAFLASDRARGLQRVIACEPTSGKVGHRHRGIGSALAIAGSPGGHSSRADIVANPLVSLARAAVALDHWGRRLREVGPPGFRGLCVNVASLDGGVAFNVIPTTATLCVSLRPAPGWDVEELLADAEGEVRRAAAPQDVEWKVTHASPPLATRDLAGFEPWLGERVRAPVDLGFWTEAALFSRAGIDAVVFGPGDIAQAHAPDEFVELSQLEMARDAFLRIFAS